MKTLLDAAITLAEDAGRAIMDVYRSGDAAVTYKEDLSPLTLADRRSHEIITSGLAALMPGIPIISEEGAHVPYEDRRHWDRFFLVDPLDGTKEFINRNGEFTVNIALIEGGRPVMGVIHIPAEGVTYYASLGGGAFKSSSPGRIAGKIASKVERIGVRPNPSPEGLVVVASRSHGSAELETYLKALRIRERISRGSALKFCLVAEGRADIYPRLSPTWEWDTGAGHAIVLEAGGTVTDASGKSTLAYNKESLKHDGFIASAQIAPG